MCDDERLARAAWANVVQTLTSFRACPYARRAAGQSLSYEGAEALASAFAEFGYDPICRSRWGLWVVSVERGGAE